MKLSSSIKSINVFCICLTLPHSWNLVSISQRQITCMLLCTYYFILSYIVTLSNYIVTSSGGEVELQPFTEEDTEAQEV